MIRTLPQPWLLHTAGAVVYVAGPLNEPVFNLISSSLAWSSGSRSAPGVAVSAGTVAVLKTDLAHLPPVQCNIGDINRVLLNLIVDAAHAVADGAAGAPGAMAPSARAPRSSSGVRSPAWTTR